MHWIAGIWRPSIPLSSISPDSRPRGSSPRSSSDTAPGIFVRSVTRPSQCRTCTASCRSSDPNTHLPVLRSLAAALQNHGDDANPATRDLPSDRTWREFQAVLGQIPQTWKQGRRDDAARNELVRTLREVSELDAGRAVIDLLKHGVSTDSIWEGIFATAAELVLRLPAVVPVHAQTSANAFHYVFRHARADDNAASGALAVGGLHAGLSRRRVRNARPDLAG